jgi:hypothetical protein
MGFFDRFMETLYINKCISTIEDVLPLESERAEDMCNGLRNFLMMYKAEGHAATEATNRLIFMILCEPEPAWGINPHKAFDWVTLASKYAQAHVMRYPTPDNRLYEALIRYAGWIENSEFARKISSSI